MFLRKKVDEIIDSARANIRNAILNFLAAKNVLEQLKRKGVDTLLMQTAFMGLPVPSKVLANIYIKSGVDSIAKALKKLRKARSMCMEKYAYIYPTLLNAYFEELESKLNDIIRDVGDIDRVVLELEDIMIKLQELREVIMNYEA